MYKISLTFILVFIVRLVAFSQSDSTQLTTIASKIEKLTATRPVEKVYLDFNKPGYNIGDTIWFKGYVTAGTHHQPSALSGILYVELLDSKDKIIKSLQLKTANGLSAGDFAIDDKINPGDYRIRAYTNWMRNASPDYFFNKAISIGNIKTSAVFITPTIEAPEKSGDGPVNAKLAYTDKLGRPYDHKTVTYEVKADTTTLYKGVGITDASGNLTLSLPAKAVAGQKKVTLVNHIKLIAEVVIDKTIPISLQAENIDVQFFPEGSQLITGVRSKVAFKAIGNNGLGADIKGTILDNENNEVAEFESQHAGMGIFAFTPQAGKTYSAKITLGDNSTITAKLPLAQEKGFVLAVNNNSSDSSKLNVRIATNAVTLAEKQNTNFYVVGQSNGAIYYTTLGKLDNLSFTAIVSKNKFPSGIVQFTLFSSTNEPLNERVVFIQNNTDLLNLDLKTQKTTYAPKEKVNMAINAKDAGNKPVQGSFSLTVFNEDKATTSEDAESTILSNILLTSDLKGYIEEPNYYFNNTSDEAKTYLDVLMLTQGYRRFEWKEIMTDRYPQITYQPEKNLSISGQLTTSTGKPIPKGKLKVLSVAPFTLIDTTTDDEGKFTLKNVEFPDSTKLVIEARKANEGKNVNISLDNNHTIPIIYKSNIADSYQNMAPPYLSMMLKGDDRAAETADTAQLAANIKASTIVKGKELKEVNISEKKLPPPSKYNGYGSVYQYNLNMEQARGYNTAYEAVQYKIPGVFYINGKLVYDRATNVINRVVVNGREYPARYMESLDPADVESIAFSAGTSTKFGGVGPVIILTTKSYAGTDTLSLKNDGGTIAFNKNNTLKDVNVKAKKIEVPDKSNLWGTLRPDAIITGDELQNYSDIVHGLIVKTSGTYYKDGKLYDPVALKKGLFAKNPPPIPVIVDGFPIKPSDNIDDVLNIDQIEDIKIVQANALKTIYGIPYENPNDKFIIVTTKQFAGTASEKADTIKNKNLKKVNLNEVTIKSRKNAGTELNPWQATVTASSNLNGPGRADQVVGADALESCSQLSDCLQAKIPGMIKKGDNLFFAIHMAQSLTSPPPILYMVDGMNLGSSLDMLDNSVMVSSIQTIEVLNSSSYLNVYGTAASGGVLIITTKIGSGNTNDVIAYKSVPGVIYTKFNGFYKAKEFYTPKYTAANIKQVNDNRTAVYWNANIITDANGNFPVEYFNSDVKGTYRAVIEGIDNDGNIGRFVYRYIVK